MKRIVTENGPDGRSRLRSVDELGAQQAVWETSPEAWLGFEPPARADMLDFQPGHVLLQALEIPPDEVMAHFLEQGLPGLDARGFHRTGTLDYLILIHGRLRLELDEGTVDLEPGDVVVQRDTNHAWRNPGPAPARCLAVISRPAVSGEEP